MNKSQKQFEIQIKKLEQLLNKAKLEENPAKFLFEQNFRAPLFQLEALSRVYAAIGNQKKRFQKLRVEFKKMEDLLGVIDYYAAFDKQFEANTKILSIVKNVFQIKYTEKITEFNRILKMKNWINGTQIQKLRAKLDEVDWKGDKGQVDRLESFFQSEIKEIVAFTNNGKTKFTDVESGIHEFRRKLRWLSIYSSALNGAIQLRDNETINPDLEKYSTPGIVNSPFNQLPQNKDKKNRSLLLSRQNFYAISWLIEQLGILKDQGLVANAISNALVSTQTSKNEKDALLLTKKYLGSDFVPVKSILNESSRITSQFFKDQVLNNLIKS